MTFDLHITGIVQGVGFRPAMFNAAVQLGLKGKVNNTADGVHVIFNAPGAQDADEVSRALIAAAPVNSKITCYQLLQLPEQTFSDFIIEQSSTNDVSSVMLAPDYAICDACRTELKQPGNPRFNYSFITCTECGPRYSIIDQLPYDRHYTSMREFEMCDKCKAEYDNTVDRRFYSQTNSCPRCGIEISLHYNDDIREGENALTTAIKLIAEGKIVAVKGVGGYLLVCDATNDQTLRTLRTRKHRPSKPFALLYPNMDILLADAHISAAEAIALRSSAAPIVLVKAKSKPASKIVKELIAPGLNSLGVMLPYAPLLEQLAASLARPLVATSGNISRSPIVYEDEEALAELSKIADAVLTHNRRIIAPQDDSVVRFTTAGRQIILRRSRGMAPSYFTSSLKLKAPILAMGAHMKSTVTLFHKNNLYVSQYLGDLESADTEAVLNNTTQHLLSITGAKPSMILTDGHPQYASTLLGNKLADERNISTEAIQHHEAHFAAVLLENELLDTDRKVLGVVWDGTGLGADGKAWGGEFFLFCEGRIQRVGHWSFFPLLLGDKMAREPRLASLSLTQGRFEELKNKFTPTEWNLYTLLQKKEKMQTNSVGRIFDAVASILNCCDRATYEGEAALFIESLAESFFEANPLYYRPYDLAINGCELNASRLIQSIAQDISNGVAASEASARFHCTLVESIKIISIQQATSAIAFSGGVFQNATLVSLIERELASPYQLYFHQQLSPNDESVSLGQVAWHALQLYRAKAPEKELVNITLV